MSIFDFIVPKAHAISLIGNLDTNKIFAENGLMGVLTNLLNLASWAAGIVSVIFVIVGGIMYIVAAGNEGATVKAKSTILWALIGLVVSISAVAITTFIITGLGGKVTT